MRSWSLMPGLGALLAAGCSSAVDYRENSGWNTAAAYTTADTRIVTQRPHPMFPGRQVICTEPSPDVAKALSTARQLTASGGNGTASASLAASAATASAVAELAGRSTALLGLRDGLYRACEAYANGALGDSAYALVLSRYGQIMITLFLGQDAGGAGAPWTAANAQASALQLPGVPAPPKGGGAGAPVGQTTTSTAPQPPALKAAAAWFPATPVAAVVPRTSARETTTTKQSSAQVPAASAADAVARMQQAYFNLSKDPLGLLLVECVNEADPTRPGAVTPALRPDGSTTPAYANEFLMGPNGLCRRVMELGLEATEAKLHATAVAQGAGAGRGTSPARRH
jgi:hypothetical protein